MGMVKDVAPHLIPSNGVYDIKNGLLGEDGSIYKRGGTENVSNAAFGTRLNFLWDGHLAAGQRTLVANSDDFGVLSAGSIINLGPDGLTMPTVATEIGGMLFIGGGYIYGGSLKTGNYSTGTAAVTAGSRTVTGTGTSFLSNADAGMLFKIGSERLYVVESVDSNTQLTLRDAYEGSTASGLAYGLYNIYKIVAASSPYEVSATYTVSTNRLIYHDARNVYFTDLKETAPIANPHLTNANDYHTVPEGVEVLSVASIGPNVLVFTTGGVWRLSGLAYDIVSPEGTPQHSFEPISREVVLWGAPGVVSWEQMLVVPGTDGIYLMDSVSSPVRISKNIDPLYQDYVENGWYPGGAAVYRSHYFLPILDGVGNVKDTLVCRLDRAVTDRRRRTVFPWTSLKDAGAEIAQYAAHAETDPRIPALYGAEHRSSARLVDCTGYFEPDADNRYDADGSVPRFEVTFRDFETGSLTENVISRVRLSYELIDGGADNPRLMMDRGDGNRLPDAPMWGDPAGEWGVGFGPSGTAQWTATEEGEFTLIERNGSPVYAPETRRDPFSFRVNKRYRQARLRLRADDRPASSCVIRRIELFLRPSLAVRK